MSEFTRTIEFTPAYDKRDSDPKKNYGIHGVNLRFLLRGERGAIQFILYTNWHLPHVQKELDMKRHGDRPHLFCHPMPADIGYHSPTSKYDGQDVMLEDCEILGGRCYYDDSALCAEPIYEALLVDGHEGVWRNLEQWYRLKFEEEAEAAS